jgi:hypothetical protein
MVYSFDIFERDCYRNSESSIVIQVFEQSKEFLLAKKWLYLLNRILQTTCKFQNFYF